MKKTGLLLSFIALGLATAWAKTATLHDFKAKTIEGKTQSLSSYKGKVLLVVNVASRCGYTPQYEGLETLYKDHKDQGLVVLGFPCNQFGGQEPGTEKEIKEFCSTRFEVTFPLFSKIDVNGDKTHPLYGFLKGGEDIHWNFTKFLVGRDGKVLQRFEPKVRPKELEEDIQKALTAKP
jgi:glutathione peroxidase